MMRLLHEIRFVLMVTFFFTLSHMSESYDCPGTIKKLFLEAEHAGLGE